VAEGRGEANQSKSAFSNPACLQIDCNVPMGISLQGYGTMTVRPSFTYFTWLPFCDLKTKPWCRRTLRICSADGSLGIDCDFAHVNIQCDRQCFYRRVFKIEVDCFFEVCRRFVFGFAEAADLKIQTAGDNIVAVTIGNVLNFLHPYISRYRQLAARQAFFISRHWALKGVES
jgi:hypothetical protein